MSHDPVTPEPFVPNGLTERRPPQWWTEDRSIPAPREAGTLRSSMWRHGDVFVISELAVMDMPDGNGTGMQWHISVSTNGERPKPKHLQRALKAFDMQQAEEDNHHPGVSRHFFLVVDPSRRVDCECKVEERVHVEPDGYTWSNDPAECRGCELRRALGPLGKPCPIHGGASSQVSP